MTIINLILSFAEASTTPNHELLILLKDILECLACKDFNSIASYKNLYLLIHS